MVLAKPGLDGHNIGLRAVARALRNAGSDVIYLGMMVTADHIVAAAVDEDADVIGLSLLNGTHMTHVPEVLEGIRRHGLDCSVVLGGIAPDDEVAQLLEMGLEGFFGPGSSTEELVAFVTDAARRRQERNES